MGTALFIGQRWWKGLRAWWKAPHSQLPRWQRAGRAPFEVGWRALKELWREDGSQVADALTFRTLFSLLPMLVLMLSIVQAFRGVEYFEQQFSDDVIQLVLPAELRGADAGEQTPGLPTADEDAAAPEQARAEYQAARRQLGERVRSLVDGLKDVNFGGLGAVGLLLFIYGATGLLSIIEGSFNRLLGVKNERPLGRRLMLYYTILTLAPLLLAAGQVARNSALAVLQTGVWADWTDWLVGPAVVLSPVVTSWVVIVAMFLLLPSTRVPFRPAAVGALVAAMLWFAAREAFAWYARTTALQSVYGAVALVPVFLLWLWLSWMVVLYGLEIADVVRRIAVQGWDDPLPERGDDRVVEPSSLVPLVVGVALAFERGQCARQSALSEQLGIGEKDVARLLQALAGAGHVRRHEDESEDVGWTLGRPAERIPVADVLRLGREQLVAEPKDPGGPAWAIVERLRRTADEALGTTTVADLLRREEGAPGAER
jgi:membrane protein